jgi:probable HAF family extracellular repeat protein
MTSHHFSHQSSSRFSGIAMGQLALAVVCSAGWATSAVFAGVSGPTYTVTPIGILPGDVRSEATGINGMVVGDSIAADLVTSRAFVYDSTGLHDLGPGFASAVNDAGVVVGRHLVSSSSSYAFAYQNGTLTNLGTLGGTGSGADGINASGRIVGWSYAADGSDHGFLYQNGTMQDLGLNVAPYAINSAGVMVGALGANNNTAAHAYVESAGQIRDLGTFGGTNSWSYDINSSGQLVGSAEYPGGYSHPFLYAGTSLQDLGVANELDGAAFSINNSGDVVGTIGLRDGEQYGFVYENGTTYDLNQLIGNARYSLTYAQSINDKGQIAAYGYGPQGQIEAVLLTPTSIPIPSAPWAALTVVPLMLLAKRYRRLMR